MISDRRFLQLAARHDKTLVSESNEYQLKQGDRESVIGVPLSL